MRKLIVLSIATCLTGCTTINGVDTTQANNGKQLVTAVAAIVVIGALAGQLGKENMKSKCANNRAGFWQDHTTGKIYTCQ